MFSTLHTLGSNGGSSPKLVASTVGAAFGEIMTAVLVNVAGWEWWPSAPTTILATFAFGYYMPNRATDTGGEE